jgi:uncharacterized protein YqjF (DUF2071 family)
MGEAPRFTVSRQVAVVEETAHRPWPLPDEPWVLAQTWNDLLFCHWPLPVEEVRDQVPGELEVETFDGSAWLGVTPFLLTDLRFRNLPPLPLLSHFLEVNVRTYVRAEDKPGIWFFNLDASSRLAVEGARLTYHLPYFWARMTREVGEREIRFRSERERAALDLSYAPASAEASPPQDGTLEAFLTERYCLYAHHEGRLYRADIHHPQWRLRGAEAELRRNTMPPPPVRVEGDPLLHLGERQDALVWPLHEVG